jgi:hypothetical protein
VWSASLIAHAQRLPVAEMLECARFTQPQVCVRRTSVQVG